MSKRMRVSIMLVGLFSVTPIGLVFSQTPDPQEKASAATLQVTEKEVRAVQNALFSRGFLKKSPSGVLDAETREALRRFQKREALEETGRIDSPTVEKLGLAFPLTSDNSDGQRRNGIFPKMGYAIKDATTATGKAIGGTAKKIGGGAKAGGQKTAETTSTVISKSGETAKDAGDATADGARSVGKGVQHVSTEIADAAVGRSDANIHRDVRELLNSKPETQAIRSQVKDGRVTLTTEKNVQTDLGDVTSAIRKVSGVKSVMVINE